MGIIGIVAEYNPLHKGHLYHMDRLRRENCAGVVVALSGDFVQRGEPAVFSKFARAEAAVRCGASLVLELPLPWCLSSAEGFARGGVGLLGATGVVDTLAFGSECGDTARLWEAVEVLEAPGLASALRQKLETGISYAAAREQAARSMGLEETEVLRTPNDLLAVEYLKAIRRQGLDLRPLAVRRSGGAHDGENSASFLRERLRQGLPIDDWIPEPARAVFRRETEAGRGPVGEEDLRLALLSRLRMLPMDVFSALPDAAEGVENLLYAAAHSQNSVEEIAMAAKSKRYALARLRRMTMAAALGLRRGMSDGTPPYLRVLAMDAVGRRLLRDMESRASAPVIIKPARLTGEPERQLFELGSRAHDLYVLGYHSRQEQRGGGDWRATPFVTDAGAP